MKKFILFPLIFCCTIICAQNPYENKNLLEINNCTYKLKWDFASKFTFEVENTNNDLFSDVLISKQGDTIDVGRLKKVSLEIPGKDILIMREIFTKHEIDCMANSYPKEMNPNVYSLLKPSIQYGVILDCNGNILNIKFRFNSYPGILNNLKPQRIYQLEKRFKKELRFVIPPEYKENYSYIPSWFYRVNLDSL